MVRSVVDNGGGRRCVVGVSSVLQCVILLLFYGAEVEMGGILIACIKHLLSRMVALTTKSIMSKGVPVFVAQEE